MIDPMLAFIYGSASLIFVLVILFLWWVLLDYINERRKKIKQAMEIRTMIDECWKFRYINLCDLEGDK